MVTESYWQRDLGPDGGLPECNELHTSLEQTDHRSLRRTGGWAKRGVIYSSGHIPSLMHVGPQMHKQSPFLALFTEFANCYSSITKGMKKIPGGMWGKRSAGRYFPSLILPSSHPLFPSSIAPDVFPILATPAGLLY